MSLQGMRSLTDAEKAALYENLSQQHSDRGPDGEGYDYGSELWELEHPWSEFEKKLRMTRKEMPKLEPQGVLRQEPEFALERESGNFRDQEAANTSGEPPAKIPRLDTAQNTPGAGVWAGTPVRRHDEGSQRGVSVGFPRGHRAHRGRRGNRKH